MESIDNIIEKIKRCMRLANRAGTDGERVAAENAARRLADANGINLSEVDAAGENVGKAVRVDTEYTYRRTGAEIGFIVNILREHFGVQVLQSYKVGSPRMKLMFFGVNLNIEVAKYVYDILMREFYKAFREAKGWGLDKRSFMTGWFLKIDAKLKEHPLRNDTDVFEEEKKAAERKYKEYERENMKAIRQKTTKGSEKDAEALYRGYMAADRVSLNRPCDGRATPSPFAIGHTRQLKGGL